MLILVPIMLSLLLSDVLIPSLSSNTLEALMAFLLTDMFGSPLSDPLVS